MHVEVERTFRPALLRGGGEHNPSSFAMTSIDDRFTRAARAAREFMAACAARHERE
jgi:hypothetical protein